MPHHRLLPPVSTKLLLLAVLLHGLSAQAGSEVDTAPVPERAHKARQIASAQRDNEQRRAAVRAALEAQRSQKPSSDDPATRGRRQLSAEERKELRQQLRQPRG